MIRQHEAVDFVCLLYVWTLSGQRNLNARRPPLDEAGKFPFANPLQTFMHLRGINVTLDDVQYRDVHPTPSGTRYHDVFGVQQSPHHVQYCRFSHSRCLSIQSKRCVTRHQEMAAWRRDQRSQHSNQIVVHVPWVTKCGGAGRHNGRHQRIDLGERWVVQFQSITGDAVQSCVVQHDDTIRVQRESLQRQNRVVRLHNHVTRFGGKQRENGIGLDQFLWIPVVNVLQQI
mmetsp:Transcript_36544/g.97361  ORF Transcript_36544/g.97361 Transcript_36544/m.97361 type:complete len:229 (-) Transcript_36544:500-1186(-)